MGRFLGLLALLIGSILIIPAFLAWGYLLRIVEHTIYGSNELPVFDDWSRMFSDGLKYIVSNIIYFIVPLALIILSLVGMGFSARSGSSQTAVYLLLLLVGLILNIFVAMVYIMAVGNMAYAERLGAAFEFSTIFGYIKGIGSLTYFAYAFVFFVILGIIGIFFNVNLWSHIFGMAGLVVGGILYIIFSVYSSMARSRFSGLMYLEGYFKVNPEDETDQYFAVEENPGL